MRATILSGIFLVSLSLTLILLLHPHDSLRPDLLIPEDALGLLVISNRLPSLDFVEHSRLGSDFGLDGKSLIRRIPKEPREQLMALFEEELKAAWFVIHRLTGKPNGSWRIHFTGLLIPRPLRRESLKLRIELAMRNLFGKGKTDLLERDSIRIYTGEESGQVLYQMLLPEGLLISNSEEGWRKTLRTAAGREASLAEKLSFQRVRNHLQIETGFFVYFDARQLLSLLPEFGYLIRWRKESGKRSITKSQTRIRHRFTRINEHGLTRIQVNTDYTDLGTRINTDEEVWWRSPCQLSVVRGQRPAS